MYMYRVREHRYRFFVELIMHTFLTRKKDDNVGKKDNLIPYFENEFTGLES